MIRDLFTSTRLWIGWSASALVLSIDDHWGWVLFYAAFLAYWLLVYWLDENA